jgi:hypothetical protein
VVYWGDYTDARNSSSGKIVGKGRLVQGSKARQIASGTFQLLSVVVAQSHLSDIETSLNVIRGSIDELNVRQENEDIAKISGALSYLCEFSNFMKELKCPEEISPQKKNTIEGIIKDAYVYRDKLEEDMSSLIKSIERLADIDNVGTGHTYKRLLELIEKIKPLLERRSIFLNLATAMNFTTAYIDPAKIEFSRIKPGNEAWCEKIELFRETITEKKKIIAKALLNSSETLELRKSKIDSSANDYHRKAAEQEKQYIDLEKSLEDNLARLIDPEGNISLAITLNEHNEVVETAIL